MLEKAAFDSRFATLPQSIDIEDLLPQTQVQKCVVHKDLGVVGIQQSESKNNDVQEIKETITLIVEGDDESKCSDGKETSIVEILNPHNPSSGIVESEVVVSNTLGLCKY